MFSPASNTTATHAGHVPQCDPGNGLEVEVDEVPDAVKSDGLHHIGIREHLHLWGERQEVAGVPSLVRSSSFHVCFYPSQVTKVLCGGLNSRPDFREQLIKVNFLLDESCKLP